MELKEKRFPGNPRNILVIRLGGLGDVVCATPVLRALRRGFPEAKIAYLTRAENACVIDGNPNVDEIITVPSKGKEKRSFFEKQKRELKFLRELRNKNFDLVINLSGGPRSSIATFATGAPVRVGFTGEMEKACDVPEQEVKTARWKSNPWRKLRAKAYTMPLATRWPLYVPELLLDSARAIGIAPDGARLEIFLSKDDKIFAEKFLSSHGAAGGQPLVCLNPGGMHASKRWPDEYFARLANLLHEKWNACILLICPGNYPVERIVNGMPQKPVVAENLPFKKMAALIQRCALFVTNDSGLKFAAVAVDVPTLTFFGSRGHVGATPPLSPDHAAMFRELPCRPCYQPECPLKTLDCLKQITPDMAMAVISEKFFDRFRSSAYAGRNTKP